MFSPPNRPQEVSERGNWCLQPRREKKHTFFLLELQKKGEKKAVHTSIKGDLTLVLTVGPKGPDNDQGIHTQISHSS